MIRQFADIVGPVATRPPPRRQNASIMPDIKQDAEDSQRDVDVVEEPVVFFPERSLVEEPEEYEQGGEPMVDGTSGERTIMPPRTAKPQDRLDNAVRA
ncbi:unnamed protein product [Peniophora sp. CBMAI 1063]|nr:unnamed protein product [Peniophora sp. CBMAI 1063]